MNAVEKIRAAYTKLPTKKIDVPEWDLAFYYKQVKGDELDLMAEITPVGATPTRSNTSIIIVKALDADGVRIFKNEEADAVYTAADPDVINRVATQMLKSISVEDQKDFSGAIPKK